MTYSLPHSLDRKVTVTIKWYCPYFIGDYKWHSIEIYEPDKCETEWITTEDKESWEAGVLIE